MRRWAVSAAACFVALHAGAFPEVIAARNV
eukprot:IDg5964t1